MVGAKERRNASADVHGKPMLRALLISLSFPWARAIMHRLSLRRPLAVPTPEKCQKTRAKNITLCVLLSTQCRPAP